MDLQIRKLKAIEYLINLQDEKILNKIEETIIEYKDSDSKVIKPFSKTQLITRAKRANKDYSTGKFNTQEQIELESDNW